MRTKTREKIVAFIQEKGGARPIELVQSLKISPQAIHRHLRRLRADGLLEVRDHGPRIRYFIAGNPQLEKVRQWHGSPNRPSENPGELICETRDVFAARLSRLGSWAKEEYLPLLISVIGEVGNNCFDHNLGHWRDIPGCWYEIQATGGKLWICVADRGQGVFRSLSRVDPEIKDDQAALLAAFERTISGRAPENRGNGLKFVRNIITRNDNRGLACRSGSGLLSYGALGPECRSELARFPPTPGGTITLMLWRLP